MTRDVEWGDIGNSKPANIAKSAKPNKTKPVREIDWGDLSAHSGNNFSDWFTKHFIDPIKATKGQNSLETAGNLMNLMVNRPIEMTGFPSAARGFFQGGENLIRGVGNLPANVLPPKGMHVPPINFPGTQQQIYPIPATVMPERPGLNENINPYVKETAETIGSIGSSLPAVKGYQGIQAGLEHLPGAEKIPALIKNILAGSTVGAALAPDNPLLGAGLGAGAEVAGAGAKAVKNFIANRRPKVQSQKYLQAQLDLERQKAAEQEAKNIAKESFGLNTPEALEMSAKKKELEFKQNAPRQEAFNRENKALPGEQTVREAEHKANNVTQALQQTLGHGEPHSLQLSEHITNAIEGVPTLEPHPKTGYPKQVRHGGLREQIGSQYDVLEHGLPEVEIPDVSKNKEIEKKVNDHLNKIMGNKATSPEEREKLKNSLIQAYGKEAGTKTIDGRSFFRAYRALRQEEGKLRYKANKFGVGIKESDELEGEANDVQKTYEEMEKIIEKHFPKDTISELHRINHEYSTQVAPLNSNKVYVQMLDSGLVPGNILEKISGKEKGNNILRQMISQNPELSRLALGHNYAKKPADLLEPNQTIEPYIQANPQIAELLGQQRQAANNLETAKQNELIVSQFKNLPKLKAEFNRQRVLAKRLRDEAEATGLSTAEVLRRREAYEQAQRKLNGFIKKSLGTSLGATIGGYAVKKLLE